MAVLFILYIPAEDPQSPSFIRSSERDRGSVDNVDQADDVKSELKKITPPQVASVEGNTSGHAETSDGNNGEQLEYEVPLLNTPNSGALKNDNDIDGKVKFVDRVTLDFSVGEPQGEYEHDSVLETVTLESALQGLLSHLAIVNDSWSQSDDKNYVQISFVVEKGRADTVLGSLSRFGIGRFPDTSISMFPADYHLEGQFGAGSEDSSPQSDSPGGNAKDKESEFMKSIKSRLTVAQVVTSVRENAVLTFDFIVFVLLASIIAALGLAESSSVVLVASMLVSPLMGPILGGVFGATIKNQELWKLGFKNELIGLITCLIVGLVFGFIPASVSTDGANWGSQDSWPTDEMKSRGMLRSLWVGVLIAIPSGAGVALSILGGNAGSLVGVAISASLLPPVVNTGMLWAFALVSAINHPTFEVPNSNASISENVTRQDVIRVIPNCGPLKDNTYQFVYSCSMQNEAVILGTVSLLLTMLNILCIVVMAVIVLKIKEVAPHIALAPSTEAFWKKDLKVARSYYVTMKGKESADLARDLQRQTAKEKEHNKVSFQVVYTRSYSSPASSSEAYFSLHNNDYKACLSDPELKVVRLSRKQTGNMDLSEPPTPETFLYPSDSGPMDVSYYFMEANIRNRKRQPKLSHQVSCPSGIDVTEARIGRFEISRAKIDEEPEPSSGSSPPRKISLSPSKSGASLARQDALTCVP